MSRALCKCKKCGKYVFKDVKVCPRCGKKKYKTPWLIIGTLIFIVAVLYGIGIYAA
jgi:RNA polymerase subunit RPABC4/transcription elongation factor Spt4